MSEVQRVLLATYLPLTGFFVVFDQVYPEDPLMRFIKFASLITLLLAGISIKKEHREQMIMCLALPFMVIGDFFLGFGGKFSQLAKLHVPLGILGFMVAYLVLIAAFQRRIRFNKGELIAAVPVLAVFIPVFFKLSGFVSGPLFYGTVVFGLVLCYMAWTGICTVFRGYYRTQVSWLIALAGYLIFISDMAVAFALFDPVLSQSFVPWLENLIWATFVPAWALVVMIIAEKDLTQYNSNLYSQTNHSI